MVAVAQPRPGDGQPAGGGSEPAADGLRHARQVGSLGRGDPRQGGDPGERAVGRGAGAEEEPVGPSATVPVNQLAGAQRLVHALRQISGCGPTAPASKAEPWHRIAVTEDIELSVREGFDKVQLGAFRELADILHLVLTRPDIFAINNDE